MNVELAIAAIVNHLADVIRREIPDITPTPYERTDQHGVSTTWLSMHHRVSCGVELCCGNVVPLYERSAPGTVKFWSTIRETDDLVVDLSDPGGLDALTLWVLDITKITRADFRRRHGIDDGDAQAATAGDPDEPRSHRQASGW